MADNYCQFSTMIECTSEQAAWLASAIGSHENEHGEHVCNFAVEDKGIWLSEEIYPDLDTLRYILEEFTSRFKYTTAILISWSETCSKPRLDSFGGGCLVVHRGKSKVCLPWEMANNWLYEQPQYADELTL